MKKAVLTEINEIKKMMGLVTEQEKVNYSECLSMIPDFYFKKTTGMGGQDYNGGDLSFWNDNKIPEFDDKEAYVRFIDHVKGAVGYENGVYSTPEMIWNESEECGDIPSWEELLPQIKFVYFDTIMKKNRKGEEKTIEDVPELISKYSEMLDINIYSDEFEWADDVIMMVVGDINRYQNLSDREFDDLYDTIKDEYGPELIGFGNPFA